MASLRLRVALLTLTGAPLLAQESWSDDLESYPPGTPIEGVGGWMGWNGSQDQRSKVKRELLSAKQAHSVAFKFGVFAITQTRAVLEAVPTRSAKAEVLVALLEVVSSGIAVFLQPLASALWTIRYSMPESSELRRPMRLSTKHRGW